MNSDRNKKDKDSPKEWEVPRELGMVEGITSLVSNIWESLSNPGQRGFLFSSTSLSTLFSYSPRRGLAALVSGDYHPCSKRASSSHLRLPDAPLD